MSFRHFSSIVMLLVHFSTSSSRIWATTYFWDNTTGGDWESAGNWSPAGGPPEDGDTAFFNNNATYTVDIRFDGADQMVVTNSTVVSLRRIQAISHLVLNSGSADLTVQDDAILNVGVPGDPLFVNVGDQVTVNRGGALTIQANGDLDADRMALGTAGIGQLSTFTVTGNGSTLDVGPLESFIGDNGGEGRLTIQNDGEATFTGPLRVTESNFNNAEGFINVFANGSLTTSELSVGDVPNFTDAGQARVTVSGNNAELTQTGTASLTIGSANNSNIGASLFVGFDGTVTSGSGTIRVQNSGELTIDEDGTFNANGDVVVDGGTLTQMSEGTFNRAAGTDVTVSGGGVFNTPTGSYVVDQGNTVTVDGAFSRWNNSGELGLGDANAGTLMITNGGAVSNASGFIGASANSTGTATISGADSDWTNSGTLQVGSLGMGTMTIEADGTVSNTAGFVGTFADTTGEVTVTGGNSTWTNSDRLQVGSEGMGTLSILDGGTVTSHTAGLIAASDGSTGVVTVDGEGSKWSISGTSLADDGFRVGTQGTGTLDIKNGGRVANNHTMVGSVLGGPTGLSDTANVDGAGSEWTTIRTLSLGETGILNVSNGGAISSGGGRNDGAVIVDGGGSYWDTGGGLWVGIDSDSATLTVQNGGSATGGGYIGRFPGAMGTVTVDGSGSTWTDTVGDLYVGGEGTGIVNILNGGSATSHFVEIGRFSGSNGAVTVDGPGSTWEVESISGLRVGSGGTGTLDIQNGGIVTNVEGYLGFDANSNGTSTVENAGSQWDNGSLRVGYGGTGSLTIQDGGVVNSNNSSIGSQAGSSGTVIVDGLGSMLDSTVLFVGEDGVGVLDIQNGGTVTGKEVSIGDSPTLGADPDGTVTVDGAGSELTIIGDSNRDELTVGGEGTGTLTIQNGGTVTVDNMDTASLLTVNPGGQLNLLAGGTLDVHGTVDIEGGTFDFLGGTLHVDQFNGELVNQGGTLAPGHSAGSTTIAGNLIHSAGADLEIEIGGLNQGTEYDFVDVTGDVSLTGGVLDVSLSSFTPSQGSQFDILTATSITGIFDNVADGQRLDTLGGEGSFVVNYDRETNKVVLSDFLPGALLGDMDCDGDVDFDDIDDFVLGLHNPQDYENQFGVPAAAKGDTDQDGDLDFDDIDDFVGILNTPASLGLRKTPEPCTTVLLSLAISTFALNGWRRWA